MNDGLRKYNHIVNSSPGRYSVTGAGRYHPIGALIHSTAGTSSLGWLTGDSAAAGTPASSDYLIDRNGDRHALCPAGRFPYHAGKGQVIYNNHLYTGDEVSQLLIGVELENLNTTLVTYEQTDSLAELIVLEGLHYGWRWPYYVLGHYETARPVGRRSDPQGFDWGSFMGRLYVRARGAAVLGLD